jgi:hypothetical protein
MFTDDIEIARVTRHEAGLCRLFDDLFDPADKALLLPRSGQWADTVNPALERVLGEQPYAGLLDDALQ